VPDLAILFEHSRTTEGTDIAAALRENFPDADIAVQLDESGAVTGYLFTLSFEEGDRAVDAAFRLTEYLRCEGIPYQAAAPDA
jgi:hypothetical protein